MNTVIVPCTCKHEYQDKKYGEDNRLHNIKANETQARCTVCKTEHYFKK